MADPERPLFLATRLRAAFRPAVSMRCRHARLGAAPRRPRAGSRDDMRPRTYSGRITMSAKARRASTATRLRDAYHHVASSQYSPGMARDRAKARAIRP